MVRIINARLIGKNDFQVKYIRTSYRIRGRVARVHRKRAARQVVFIIMNLLFKNSIFPEKIRLVNKHIIRMFEYSAMNKRANIPLLYSVLNPETNSDSPSAKSKGVRLVSAKLVIYHIQNTGIIRIRIHEFMCSGME